MPPERAPATLSELADAVRATPRVLAVGAGTKPRLGTAGADVARLTTTRLRGIVEYEPTEFTFTALAGTPVREIAATLAGRGQYLPFDPPWSEAGATLGGTVAAGVNGPGRLRFGGLRDFILGVRFVDGAGRVLRLGGKVVKNAAGFDVPKFLVGSLGRFGILAEITFKVFPRPPSTLTLRLPVSGVAAGLQVMSEAARARWEVHALEFLPGDPAVLVRLDGPESALPPIAREILARWAGEVVPADEAGACWRRLREFTWTHPEGALVKLATSPATIPALASALAALAGARWHLGLAGNVAWVSLPPGSDVADASAAWRGVGLTGLLLRGAGPLWSGAAPRRPAITDAVKRALDPEQRFPQLDEG